MSLVEHALQTNPLIVIHSDTEGHWSEGRITRIDYGTGRIAVHHVETSLSRRQLLSVVLASVGLSNAEISASAYMSITTTKTHLSLAFKKLEVAHRSALARQAFDAKLYTVSRPGQPLGLSAREQTIVGLASKGNTNDEIANELDRSELTIKGRLAKITEKTGWVGREAIVLAALLSGEVGNYTDECGGQLEIPFEIPHQLAPPQTSRVLEGVVL